MSAYQSVQIDSENFPDCPYCLYHSTEMHVQLMYIGAQPTEALSYPLLFNYYSRFSNVVLKWFCSLYND